jgi:hypothetical protein
MFQIVKEERNNINRLEFLIPQPLLIHSLAKIIKGAMIYDDDRIVRFKAACIERLGEKKLSYEESLQFVWCIATQLKWLILEKRCCFYTFRLENIWRMDDTFVYIDDLMDIDEMDNIQITRFINKDDVFLSPELRAVDRIPVDVHYKTIYYSFGKLLQTISMSEFDDIVLKCTCLEPKERSIRF